MPTTTEVPLHDAVVTALAALTEIVADETADTGTYRYKYATLAGIMRTIRPLLAEHGLAVSQMVSGDDGVLALETVLVHRSGELFRSGVIRAKLPATPQQIGSLVSYLRRYQLVALLGLAVEDDDARTAAPPPPAPARQSRVTRPATPGQLSESQRRLIMTLFGDLGLSGPDLRDIRLAMTSEILGRELTTTNEVTPREAGALIDELQRRVAEQGGQGY